MIGRSGERGSGISVLAARHDDDDVYIYIYIYICIYVIYRLKPSIKSQCSQEVIAAKRKSRLIIKFAHVNEYILFLLASD